MAVADRKPQFVTFVNPEPVKGVYIFARIAAELARRRPDIRLLAVESRGQADSSVVHTPSIVVLPV
jgi:hypothetical protein